AMEVATLARTFPGRLVPGVGHGVQDWMGQAGVRVASPLTLLREHTTALRRLLAGEEVTTSGRYVTLDRVRLDWPPTEPVPLWLGGVGPRSLALAGELGDGLILANALTPDDVRGAAEAARGGGAGEGFDVHATLIAATGPDAQERVDREVPLWGREPGQGVGAAGDAQAFATAVGALADAGATAVAIQPTADEPDLEGVVRFPGREGAPLLSARGRATRGRRARRRRDARAARGPGRRPRTRARPRRPRARGDPGTRRRGRTPRARGGPTRPRSGAPRRRSRRGGPARGRRRRRPRR